MSVAKLFLHNFPLSSFLTLISHMLNEKQKASLVDLYFTTEKLWDGLPVLTSSFLEIKNIKGECI